MYRKDLGIDEIRGGYFVMQIMDPSGKTICNATGVTVEECEVNANKIVEALNMAMVDEISLKSKTKDLDLKGIEERIMGFVNDKLVRFATDLDSHTDKRLTILEGFFSESLRKEMEERLVKKEESKPKTLKVKIVRHSSQIGAYWYKNRINEVFEVQEFCGDHFTIVENGERNIWKQIKKVDCEIIEE